MSLGSHLLDTCTIERAATQPDGYRHDDPARGDGWEAVATQQPCRLVVKDQRVGDGVFSERPVVTTYTMLFGAGADVLPGDRITTVVQPDGAAAGTYRIESVLKRRSHRAHHLSCRLEKIG